jgi:hypothetical protein
VLINVLNLLDLSKRSCYKENKSDREKMRKKFKLLIKKGSKARIKETEGRKNIKKPLATKLSKSGKQSGESKARHLLYPGMVNKSANKRSIPDSSKLSNVNLKY